MTTVKVVDQLAATCLSLASNSIKQWGDGMKKRLTASMPSLVSGLAVAQQSGLHRDGNKNGTGESGARVSAAGIACGF